MEERASRIFFGESFNNLDPAFWSSTVVKGSGFLRHQPLAHVSRASGDVWYVPLLHVLLPNLHDPRVCIFQDTLVYRQCDWEVEQVPATPCEGGFDVLMCRIVCTCTQSMDCKSESDAIYRVARVRDECTRIFRVRMCGPAGSARRRSRASGTDKDLEHTGIVRLYTGDCGETCAP